MVYGRSTITYKTILWGMILLCSYGTSPAAEIRLKKIPVPCSETLVTLADIADVLPMGNENVEPLRQMVLFPTPSDGTTRTLDQWEVRTMLSQLGINSLHHFISGAEKVTVLGIAPVHAAPIQPNEQFVVHASHLAPTGRNPAAPVAAPSEISPPLAGLTEEIARQLEKQVAQALNLYLNFTNRIDRTWDISLQLTPEQIRLFATNGQIVDITGGQIPFTGTQQFRIRMQSEVMITVEAMVALPREVVIVRRALPKGHLLAESDVMMQRADKMTGEDFFVDINSVVGKETVKAVKEWTPLTPSAVRLPVWVRRGEVVTVRAVKGGMVVRTEASALQDGAEGDTIAVAKIDLSPKKGKKEEPVTYLVRVCAPKTVEVFVK